MSSRRPRRRRRQMHPLAVAATVILAAVAITYYAFNKELPFVHRFTLYALVSNSVNVRGGDPVRLDGIDVGQVQGVSGAGNESKIEFTLDSSALPVHRDATVRIRDRLFLEGSYYLQLDPGTPDAPVLPGGATIPLSQTSSPVQFYQVLSLFDAPTRANLVNLLDALDQGFGPSPGKPLQDSGAGALRRAVPQLQPLLADSAIVSRALRGTTPGDVGTLLRSSASVAGTLAQSSAQLAGLVSALNATSSALASSDGALAQTVSGLDQTVRATPAALEAVDRALPPLTGLARALDPSLKVAPPIVGRLTKTVSQLAAALAPSERGPLIASLRATFQQLPAIITQLASTFPVGKLVTDCLQSHVVPVIDSEVPDGSLSTGRSVWQDFVHFLPGIAGASANFDANGPYTRFLAGAGTNTLSMSFGGQQLVSTAPPGGTSLQGARPQWVGDLTAADFRPDVPCSTQKVPSLASPTAPPDLTPTSGTTP